AVEVAVVIGVRGAVNDVGGGHDCQIAGVKKLQLRAQQATIVFACAEKYEVDIAAPSGNRLGPGSDHAGQPPRPCLRLVDFEGLAQQRGVIGQRRVIDAVGQDLAAAETKGFD